MFCTLCGNEIAAGAAFCTSCGAPAGGGGYRRQGGSEANADDAAYINSTAVALRHKTPDERLNEHQRAESLLASAQRGIGEEQSLADLTAAYIGACTLWLSEADIRMIPCRADLLVRITRVGKIHPVRKRSGEMVSADVVSAFFTEVCGITSENASFVQDGVREDIAEYWNDPSKDAEWSAIAYALQEGLIAYGIAGGKLTGARKAKDEALGAVRQAYARIISRS
ncbi:MAG: zinc ribbon domain-containing protein [Candidatus Methanoplasma sp.]|jgi:hypothetical protein|nr:zinc ribbon domain-containing protein [Candidatus Methanoplasma sp.]